MNPYKWGRGTKSKLSQHTGMYRSTDSTHNPSRAALLLVCMLFTCYMPFSAKVKIPIIMVAFFDVQQGRCLVHMEETEKVFVLPYSKVTFPRGRLFRAKSFRILMLSGNKWKTVFHKSNLHLDNELWSIHEGKFWFWSSRGPKYGSLL